MGVAVTLQIQAFLNSAWEDLTSDTVAVEGCAFHYGIQGNGPLDVCCSPGELSFTLNNAANNSGGVQGYYSPHHANVRTGWGFGVPIRVRLSSGVTSDQVKWYGRVSVIDAEPGQYRAKRVRVIAQDQAFDLIDADVKALAIEVNQTDAQLVTAILDAAPSVAQPIARSLDAGVDTTTHAFNDLGDRPKALQLIRDVVLSSGGLAFIKGDGTFVFKNRHSRATTASALTLTNIMHGLEAPSSLETCWNRVRVTINPKAISDSATEELVEVATAVPMPGYIVGTQQLFFNYTDPDDRSKSVSALDVATSGDYELLVNGNIPIGPLSGAVITPFASRCMVEITHPDGSAPHLTTVELTALSVQGRPVRTLAQESYEANVAKPYDRLMVFELPYQDDANVAQGLATFIAAQYAELADQIASVTFLANDSDTLMQAALLREPGDRITINETMTGLAADAIIHAVDISIRPGPMLTCRWDLAPAAPWSMWSLGDDGFTELGETTILGF